MKYPAIGLTEIQTFLEILENAQGDSAYFDPAFCPYDETIVQELRKVVQAMDVTTVAVVDAKNPVGRPTKAVALPVDEVEKEINEIRTELASLKLDGQSLEVADRIQIIKTRAALLEKVIGMKERTNNLKRQSLFITNVIGIMEDNMAQTEREKVIKQLEPYLEQ